MATRTTCKICDRQLNREVYPHKDCINFDCPNCGFYAFEQTAYEDLDFYLKKSPSKAAILAHFVRKRTDSSPLPVIDIQLIERAFSADSHFPNAFEQIENLIIWLAENAPYPGHEAQIDFAHFQAIIGCADERSFAWVIHEATGHGWIEGIDMSSSDDPGALLGSLTLRGWEWFEEIGRHKRSRLAFMAMQFGDSALDAIVENYFKPAVVQTGFELQRLNDGQQAGLIDNRMRVQIRRSRFTVCDLTHKNAGAYWEGGFAEGLHRPVFYTCEQSKFEQLHFDTRNCLVIAWNSSNPTQAADDLKDAIRNTLPEEAELTDPD